MQARYVNLAHEQASAALVLGKLLDVFVAAWFLIQKLITAHHRVLSVVSTLHRHALFIALHSSS